MSLIFLFLKKREKRAVYALLDKRGWDEVVNDRFPIELQLFCSTLAVVFTFTLLVVLFNWFHAPFITLQFRTHVDLSTRMRTLGTWILTSCSDPPTSLFVGGLC